MQKFFLNNAEITKLLRFSIAFYQRLKSILFHLCFYAWITVSMETWIFKIQNGRIHNH